MKEDRKKEERDFAILYQINQHNNDLNKDLDGIETLDNFVNADNIRRAILFDFFQIGELLSQLSEPFLKEFNNKHASDLISMRNRIVHGYGSLRDDIIFYTLKNDFPQFIDELMNFGKTRYKRMVKNLLGKKIKVIIDRPIGFNHEGIIYEVNYGYTKVLTALDGQFQDVYIIDSNVKEETVEGFVIAVIDREDDVENKLIVSINNQKYSKTDIEKAVRFQEQFFKHIIITN